MAMVAAVRPKSLFHLALVFVSLALLLAVAYPLWKPLLIGAVLAATLLPWHDRLSGLLRGRRHLAAALVLIGIILLLLLPLAWLISVAVRESLGGIAFLRQTLETHGPEVLLERLPEWLAEPVRSGLESKTSGPCVSSV